MKKYEVIFKALEKQIINNQYKVGNYLPTEKELTDSYQVSRDTIRKALQLLTEAGYIRKIHGSGSQIIKHDQINLSMAITLVFDWSPCC